MNVLGISAFYHESACALLRDGQLVAAAAEERFSRRKHDPRLPVAAFRFCLDAAGLDVTDLDAVAFYEDPVAKLSRQLWCGPRVGESWDLPWLDPGAPERGIRERLGIETPLLCFPHHRSHAASAFFYSGFEEAAILVADGVGEWATTSYGRAKGTEIDLFEEVSFPHGLGLLYSTLTGYLGFRVNSGEYKVMGLAPYGEPRYVDQVCQLIGMGPDGQFLLARRNFDFIRGRRMYSPALVELFGRPPRRPEDPIEDFHRDVARSLQLVVEEILLEKAAWLHRRAGAADLCYAGGVALNCVVNGRLRREGPFRRIFVPPAPGDAGGALGAAALAHVELTGTAPRREPLRHAFYGPRFDADIVTELLEDTGVPFSDFRQRRDDLAEEVAQRLAEGAVVAFFHGAMELGPRALGGRSLLADPRRPDMRDRMNAAVKKREAFRPFAPCVLKSRAAEHFDLDPDGLLAPFMLETCRVRSPLDLPAVTHVDGSARPQVVDPAIQPRFAALLQAFEGCTGCPILLQTSFNVRGEPIVATPEDALFCFGTTDIDALVLEDALIDRSQLPDSWPELFLAWRGRPKPAALDPHLYTFV
ncbi:MAG: carbamoyltransferase N-terminal domain-containing protein [Acidobacteriota bacterium]